MKLQQLKYYCETYEQLNITKAAKKLFVSPPAVSNSIHDLENEFNYQFFLRNNNLLTPTPEGDAFYKAAKSLLSQVEQFERDMHALAFNQLTVRIGVPPLIGSFILPRFTDFEDAIHQFKKPISFSTMELPVHELLPKLKNGQIDAFIANSKSADFSEAHSILLCTMPFYVVCHKHYPLAKKSACCSSDLLNYPLLMLTGHSAPLIIKEWFQSEGHSIEFHSQFSQISSIENMLLREQGYFISSDTTPFHHPDLVQIPLLNPPIAEVCIYYLPGKTLGCSAIEFLNFLSKLPF